MVAVQMNYDALFLMGAYAFPSPVKKLHDAFSKAYKKRP